MKKGVREGNGRNFGLGVLTWPIRQFLVLTFSTVLVSGWLQAAIAEMRVKVDTLITVSNDRLLQIVPESFPLKDAFLVADAALKDGVVGISDIIVKPGLINVDFADVRAVMQNAGTALMGTGWGTSPILVYFHGCIFVYFQGVFSCILCAEKGGTCVTVVL